MHQPTLILILVFALVGLSGVVAAQEPVTTVATKDIPEALESMAQEVTSEPEVRTLIQELEHEVDGVRQTAAEIIDPHGGQGDGSDGIGDGRDGGANAPGLGAALLAEGGALAGLAALSIAALFGAGAGGVSLMARYIDPKQALDNPARAMLFGFIKGNPGVHLKQLSDDFDMKTSTVLWHVRKLEAAELVRSQKVNGFRVFYPVAGGIEAKKVGAAVAAIANENALRILEYVCARPGIDQRVLVDTLEINAGTVRWHLRKLRDRGILREITEGRSSHYSPTELGQKALVSTRGTVVPTALPPGTPTPVADRA